MRRLFQMEHQMKLADVVGYTERREIKHVGDDLIPGPVEHFLVLQRADKQLEIKVPEEAVTFVLEV